MEKKTRTVDVKKNNAEQLAKFILAPFNKRILFLPHCLQKDFRIEIKDFAEKLGYNVVVAAGGSQVFKAIQKFKPQAIVGIACMREIYLAVSELEDINLPYQSLELSDDGCKNTKANIDEAKALLSQVK